MKSLSQQLAEALAQANNIVVVSPDEVEVLMNKSGFVTVHGYGPRLAIMDREIGACGGKRYVLAQ